MAEHPQVALDEFGVAPSRHEIGRLLQRRVDHVGRAREHRRRGGLGVVGLVGEVERDVRDPRHVDRPARDPDHVVGDGGEVLDRGPPHDAGGSEHDDLHRRDRIGQRTTAAIAESSSSAPGTPSFGTIATVINGGSRSGGSAAAATW